MWCCKFCGKEFDNLTPSGKANHSRWCEKNPKKMSYLRGLETMRNNLTPEQRNKAN